MTQEERVAREKKLIEEYGEADYNEYIKTRTYYLSLGAPDLKAAINEVAIVHPKNGYIYLADKLEYFIWIITRNEMLTKDEIITKVFNNQKYGFNVNDVAKCLENLVKAKFMVAGTDSGKLFAKAQTLNECDFKVFDLSLKDKVKAYNLIKKKMSVKNAFTRCFVKNKYTENEQLILNYFETNEHPFFYGSITEIKEIKPDFIIDNAVEALESLLKKGDIYVAGYISDSLANQH